MGLCQTVYVWDHALGGQTRTVQLFHTKSLIKYSYEGACSMASAADLWTCGTLSVSGKRWLDVCGITEQAYKLHPKHSFQQGWVAAMAQEGHEVANNCKPNTQLQPPQQTPLCMQQIKPPSQHAPARLEC